MTMGSNHYDLSSRRLSLQEADILRALMTGTQSTEVASGLGLSESVVQAHIKAILRKVRVKRPYLQLVGGIEMKK
jgi:DNA-binding CsgD family transcriptional regulator